jgi:hypothetical protein
MGLMDRMMGAWMGRMSKEEKNEMMDGMMDKMMSTFTAEEKQQMMEQMMPKMMADINMLDMMPKMMLTMMPKMIDEVKALLAEQGKSFDLTEVMPKVMGPFMLTMLREVPAEKMVEHKEHMMTKMHEREDLRLAIPERQQQMMPGCMKRMMENIPYEEKAKYAPHLLGILVTNGSENITTDQKVDYKNKLLATINNNL